MLTWKTDHLWTVGLLLIALVLFGINLGGLPLRDWDEGIVAQVAREIWRSPSPWLTWLYPTVNGEPYFNKPPLVHGLIAIAYALGGVNEWTSRLPGALLTAFSVPLLYWVGREAFHRHLPALFAALVYLTMLPVVRHGRLAMLDGAILCFALLTVWWSLRSRRDSRYALGVGIGLGLICLTKGVMVGVLMGTIVFVFLGWDTPRLLLTPYLWLGILLGLIPVGGWYGAQWFHYGQDFWVQNLLNQSLRRIAVAVEDNGAPPWYYVLELLKYGFPWLLFLPTGIKYTWEHRNLSWAKLALTWSSIYLMAISLMSTKLPWYSLPLYPPLALITGMQLSRFWHQGNQEGRRPSAIAPYSLRWAGLFGLLGVVGGMGSLYYSLLLSPAEPDIALTLAAVTITMLIAAGLIAQNDALFVPVILWGTYVSLLLLMLSAHWVWELAEAYPVKPVAALIQQYIPSRQPVYTSYPYQRPSLDFYSDRPVIPLNKNQLKRLWKRDSNPYLLVDDEVTQFLKPGPEEILGSIAGWNLITH